PTELSGAGYRRGHPRRHTSRRSHCEQAHGRHPFSARLARSTRGARICLTGSVRCNRLGSRRGTASVLAATQSETAVPPKTDFETWAPKTAENARQNVSVVRLTNSAIQLPQASGKRREFDLKEGKFVLAEGIRTSDLRSTRALPSAA